MAAASERRWRTVAVERQMTRSVLLAWAFVIAGALLDPAAADDGELLSVDTQGGLKVGARVIRVTTLDDSGPGSLRDALSASGPRVVVFDVSGYIDLKSDVSIESGEVTVAGETAPASGVVIRGATLRVRASDVVLQHLAVMPGPSPDPRVAQKRDGVSLYGSVSRKSVVRNVVLRNVSVGWSVDENIGMQGLVDGVRIERSLIFEGLRRGGHPKGNHSMNMVAGHRVRRVLVLGNVFASAEWRSPRFTNTNLVAILNNLIYGPGRRATQFDSSSASSNGAVMDVVGNAYKPSADTQCDRPMIAIDSKILKSRPPTRIFLGDNMVIGSADGCVTENAASPIHAKLRQDRAWSVPQWTLTPASTLYPDILDLAGARPAARNPIDARVIAGIRDGSGRIIDDERSVGGWPRLAATERRNSLPVSGDIVADDAALSALEAWLCRRREIVEGRRGACDGGESR
jgi:hypothetical protein